MFPSPAGLLNKPSVKPNKNKWSAASDRISSVMSSPSIVFSTLIPRLYSVLSCNRISPTVKSNGPGPSGSDATATTGVPPPTGVNVSVTRSITSSSFSQGGALGSSATFREKVRSKSVVPVSTVEELDFNPGWCFRTTRKEPETFPSTQADDHWVINPIGLPRESTSAYPIEAALFVILPSPRGDWNNPVEKPKNSWYSRPLSRISVVRFSIATEFSTLMPRV